MYYIQNPNQLDKHNVNILVLFCILPPAVQPPPWILMAYLLPIHNPFVGWGRGVEKLPELETNLCVVTTFEREKAAEGGRDRY
jgi:hypothetical protein